MRRELNRPEEDDLFVWPDEYENALDEAVRHYRRLTAQHYPDLLYQEATIEEVDGEKGTYQLPDGSHLGEMEVWSPPGPIKGHRIRPGTPTTDDLSFFIQGDKMRLTRDRTFTPGLYIRWIPEVPDEDTPPLPRYYDRVLVLRAAAEMAEKPGYMGDPQRLRQRANHTWMGHPEDPSDGGILGTIERQTLDRGYEGVMDRDSGRWWQGITSDV